jgi:hypothetical protein
MSRKRLILGPITRPTWKDYFKRVGGAMALVVVTILLARVFLPDYVGVAVIVVCAALIAFASIQEWRSRNETHERRKR